MPPEDDGTPLVWRCCRDRAVALVFRVQCQDRIVLVLSCAEHELQTGLLLTEIELKSHD